MRILHVITGLDVGGAERLLIDVVLNLKRAGHDVSIIYFKSGPHEKTLKDCNIAVVHVRGFFFTYDPFLIFTLYKVIKKINPDCIHGWLWMANLLSRIVAHLLSIPQLSSLHNNVDQDGFVRNCIDKYTYNYAQKLVPISQGVAYSLAKKHPWICTKSVHVVPNGIDSAAICEQIAHKKKKKDRIRVI